MAQPPLAAPATNPQQQSLGSRDAPWEYAGKAVGRRIRARWRPFSKVIQGFTSIEVFLQSGFDLILAAPRGNFFKALSRRLDVAVLTELLPHVVKQAVAFLSLVPSGGHI